MWEVGREGEREREKERERLNIAIEVRGDPTKNNEAH